MSKPDNPPAFPRVADYSADGLIENDGSRGMTLRDYFAGQALSNPAICTGVAPEWQLRIWFGDHRGGIMPAEIAVKQARSFADAMLAERERNQ